MIHVSFRADCAAARMRASSASRVRDLRRLQVYVAHAETKRQQVQVAVVERRHRQPPGEVDPRGARARQRLHRVARAAGYDAAAVDRERLGEAVVQAAEDAATGDQRVGVAHRFTSVLFLVCFLAAHDNLHHREDRRMQTAATPATTTSSSARDRPARRWPRG